MRREFSKRLRLEIVDRAMNSAGQVVCEGCGLILASKRYEIDHIIPEALVVDKTKALTAADGQLLGASCCHRGGNNKTADDVARIAKAKRSAAKHVGIRRAPSMPGSRLSKWKRKMNGEVVLR